MAEEEIRELMRLIVEIKENLEELKVALRAMLPRLRIARRVPLEVAEEILSERIMTAQDLNETRILYMSMLERASPEKIRELLDLFRSKADRASRLLEQAEEAHAIDPERFTSDIIENLRRMYLFWLDMIREAERRLGE